MKVIAFPFAGGNKYSFNFLKEYLPKDKVTLSVLEYPGRGRRTSESLLENIDEIVADAFDKLITHIGDEDYLIYGHSMGALVGYLLCQKIKQTTLKRPFRLVVSGFLAPAIDSGKHIHDLSKEEFWTKVEELGGFPKEFTGQLGLRNFFEPILRADFKVVEQYKYVPLGRLNLPIDVFFGDEEVEDEAAVRAWEQETSKNVHLFKCKGNHFFIHSNANEITNSFLQGLEETTTATL